ncbi:MAG: 2'-5' RNA ligase family protein [Bacteroidetes bacterium]|nr:2'-5' RNA ligase family protein [Bacteroidota bacterium]
MTTNNPESLYFIAIIPPQPIFNKIFAFKEHMAANYDSKAALKSPPHITLQMPFKWDTHKEEILTNTLQQFSQQQIEFEMELLNFSHFESRVLYIDIVANNYLHILQKELAYAMQALQLFNSTHKSNGFKPHITIAFRDLKKQQFQLAWKEFIEMKYHAKFKVNSICLLKHNGKTWDVFKELNFKKNNE